MQSVKKITSAREKLQEELDILNSRIENIPAESIDIDKIINQISQTQKRKQFLQDKSQDFNFKVWELEESLSSKSKEFDAINIGELRLLKASADSIEHKIKETRQALDNWISQEKVEKEENQDA